MCGIAGFVGIDSAWPDAAPRLKSMCDAIEHRGPDSDGFFVENGIALGMRRLSVIDVAGGRQPIFNEDGSVVVVFNGEIYNHHELRRELMSLGHRFATRSDTEVLVHLYEQYGAGMVGRLNGMFAFAIWDHANRYLLIARDRAGMKPLSYCEIDGGLVFGSELRSLAAFGLRDLTVSSPAVMHYLAFGYVPDPASIFEGVKKLPPGHYLAWRPGKHPEVRRYWTPPVPELPVRCEDDLVDELKIRLDTAVARHLESEVPLGAFLSGGLDSSTVVALMARHAHGRVRTFSIGFSEPSFDESAAAREVAAAFGTQHTELIVTPNVEEIFDHVARLFDEPFADASAIPTFLVAQLARESVTVALSGDGGDELFGGYARYREILSGGCAPPTTFQRAISLAGSLLPHFAPGKNRLLNVGRSPWGKYAATVIESTRLDEGGVARRGEPIGQLPTELRLQTFVRDGFGEDFAAAMMDVDLQTYLPGDILTKVDRTTMAVSLEARVPFLDADLMDFALSIPGHLRVDAGQGKKLFRRAIRELVPGSVMHRPKQGFGIPLGRWFRGPLRHRVDALRQLSCRLQPFVDASAVRRIVFEHLIGRRDHHVMIWRLIVLDNWLENLESGGLRRAPAIPRLAAMAA